MNPLIDCGRNSRNLRSDNFGGWLRKSSILRTHVGGRQCSKYLWMDRWRAAKHTSRYQNSFPIRPLPLPSLLTPHNKKEQQSCLLIRSNAVPLIGNITSRKKWKKSRRKIHLFANSANKPDMAFNKGSSNKKKKVGNSFDLITQSALG